MRGIQDQCALARRRDAQRLVGALNIHDLLRARVVCGGAKRSIALRVRATPSGWSASTSRDADDGRLWFDGAGNESKAYNVHDGLGLRLLEDNGIAVALVTARDSPSARARAKDLRLSHCFSDIADKVACMDSLRVQLGLEWREIAYMGDDLHDLPLFPRVAWPWRPPTRTRGARHAHWITPRNGPRAAPRCGPGQGAGLPEAVRKPSASPTPAPTVRRTDLETISRPPGARPRGRPTALWQLRPVPPPPHRRARPTTCSSISNDSRGREGHDSFSGGATWSATRGARA